MLAWLQQLEDIVVGTIVIEVGILCSKDKDMGRNR